MMNSDNCDFIIKEEIEQVMECAHCEHLRQVLKFSFPLFVSFLLCNFKIYMCSVNGFHLGFRGGPGGRSWL